MRRQALCMLVILATAAVSAQPSPPRTEHFRDEDAFKRGISLFPFEIHDAGYLKVTYDGQRFVQVMAWYTAGDSLLRTRTSEYWPDDISVKRMLELTPDSAVARELLFSDEVRPRRFIE